MTGLLIGGAGLTGLRIGLAVLKADRTKRVISGDASVPTPLSIGAGMYLPVVPGSGHVSTRCPREVKENLIFFRNETSLSIIE